MERIFYRSPATHIVLKLTIQESFYQPKCENALLELQRIHPRLTCTVLEDDNHKLRYCTNSNLKIPVTCYDHDKGYTWQQVVKEQLKIPFLMEKELSVRVCIVTNINEFDLILVTDNTLGDGLSVLYALQDFLEIYFKGTHLQERPSPVMTGKDLPKGNKLNWAIRLMIRYVNHVWKKQRLCFHDKDFSVMFDKYQNINSADFLSATLDKLTMDRLYVKLRQENVTMNSLIVTAILFSLSHSNLTTKQEQKVIIATNLRNKIACNPAKGIGNYAGAVTPTLFYRNELDFWSNVKHIHKQIKNDLASVAKEFMLSQVFDKIDTSIFDELYFNRFTETPNENAKKIAKFLKLSRHEEGYDISNLGRFTIAPLAKITAVKDFVYLPPEAINMDFTFGVITVANQLSLSLIYKEHKVDHESMEFLLKYTVELLKKVSESTIKGEVYEKESESENVI